MQCLNKLPWLNNPDRDSASLFMSAVIDGSCNVLLLAGTDLTGKRLLFEQMIRAFLSKYDDYNLTFHDDKEFLGIYYDPIPLPTLGNCLLINCLLENGEHDLARLTEFIKNIHQHVAEHWKIWSDERYDAGLGCKYRWPDIGQARVVFIFQSPNPDIDLNLTQHLKQIFCNTRLFLLGVTPPIFSAFERVVQDYIDCFGKSLPSAVVSFPSNIAYELYNSDLLKENYSLERLNYALDIIVQREVVREMIKARLPDECERNKFLLLSSSSLKYNHKQLKEQPKDQVGYEEEKNNSLVRFSGLALTSECPR
jgi:ribosomal protein S15P/S13E